MFRRDTAVYMSFLYRALDFVARDSAMQEDFYYVSGYIVLNNEYIHVLLVQ